MPIVTVQGISTEELCEESKKYLSCLLIGKTGIKPDFLDWDLFLTERFNLNPIFTAYQQTQALSKRAIIDKLVEIEIQPYEPKIKKQQAELHSKILAGISIALIIFLTIAYAIPFALGLLGSASTLIGVISLALGVSLTCCFIIPAFFGERMIDPEWIKEYDIVKEKWQQKLGALKSTSETEMSNEETDRCSDSTVSNIQQIKPRELNTASPIRLIPATSQNTKIINNFSIFNKTSMQESDFHLQLLNTSAKNSY